MNIKNTKLFEKVINFLLNILVFIFGVIFLISIYTGVQTKILGNKYTNFFGYSLFEVQTGSMEETINPGDWIIVKLTQNIKLNDIITYESNGEYITHRVIEVYNGTFVTKGDANNAKDQPVDQKKVVGKVVNILAGFGILRKSLFNPSVLIALIITLFLLNMAIKKKNEKFDKMKVVQLVKKYKVDKYFNIIIDKIKNIYKKVIELFNKFQKNRSKQKISEIKSKEDNNESIQTDEKKYDFSQYDDDDEDDLGKTSLYRVISIDGAEVDDKYKETVEVEQKVPETDDQLDKTLLYRVVPVDLSELDDTFLEIAENEIKKNDKDNEKSSDKKEIKEEQITEEEKENLIKIDLDLLKKKKGRKDNSIIENAMLIKEEELNEIIISLLGTEKLRINESTIKEKFIEAYIDTKYYNFSSEYDIEYNGRSLNLKIEKTINKVTEELINKYKGKNKNYKDIVNEYNKLFDLIANLDKAKVSIEENKIKSEFYKKEITKYTKNWSLNEIEYVVKKIIDLQKKYDNMLEYFLKRLETNMFDLNLNKLSSIKDMYALSLEHNLTFSKIYSDYVIDKTYTEGVIAEDKIVILLTLLSSQLVKDMTLSNFDKKYIFYIPNSLYSKEKKLEKVINIIDNEYAKDNVIISLTFEDLTNNKQVIKKLRKEGYKFALVFNKEITMKVNDIKNLYIVNYIFVDKKVKSIISFIPKDLLNNVIYEDIVDKIGDFGSDKE